MSSEVEMCGNSFFVTNPSHFSDFIPIPITLPFETLIPFPFFSIEQFPIPSHSHSRSSNQQSTEPFFCGYQPMHWRKQAKWWQNELTVLKNYVNSIEWFCSMWNFTSRTAQKRLQSLDFFPHSYVLIPISKCLTPIPIPWLIVFPFPRDPSLSHSHAHLYSEAYAATAIQYGQQQL